MDIIGMKPAPATTNPILRKLMHRREIHSNRKSNCVFASIVDLSKFVGRFAYPGYANGSFKSWILGKGSGCWIINVFLRLLAQCRAPISYLLTVVMYFYQLI